jgi:hypothetical protein
LYPSFVVKCIKIFEKILTIAIITGGWKYSQGVKMTKTIAIIWIICCFILTARAELPAFPEAEGSGRYATGGRGGTVYEVTNLNNSGTGSIVDAVSTGNRTIVFRVSGTIPLGDVILKPKSNTTIAGQTAPGDGICLKGRIQIGSVSNVVIRYFRIGMDEPIRGRRLESSL